MTSPKSTKNEIRTLEVSPVEIENMRKLLEETDWDISGLDHGYFKASQGHLRINAYKSGKVVVTGPRDEMDNILDTITTIRGDMFSEWTDHIGVDESGKGDFFGPLVIAGAYVKKTKVEDLVKLGIKDSKKIADKKTIELRAALMRLVDFEEISLSPSKYNDLYDKTGNINKILAWGHAQVMENLLERNPECGLIVTDQFARSKDRIKDALMEKGRKVELVQMHRGEADLAVAAASVIARGRFLLELAKMKAKYGIEFPKGAGEGVISSGGKYLSSYSVLEILENKIKAGEVQDLTDSLRPVAKVHFTTSSKILKSIR